MTKLTDAFNRTVRPQGHVFYGWWIALATGGIHLLSSLLWMQSYGAYVVLLQAEFGWSKTVVAGAFALTRIESGLLGPIQGWLVDRFGPRIIVQIGMVLYGIGFMLFSQVDTILTFYLTFALMARVKSRWLRHGDGRRCQLVQSPPLQGSRNLVPRLFVWRFVRAHCCFRP